LIYSKRIIFLLLFLLFPNFIKATSPDPISGKKGMVVSANDLATDVGVKILKQGGNAIDAAVAVGFTLAVTYPAAGNIGGGGFMVIHLTNGKEIAIDFRERAPGKASKNMYLDSKGNFVPELSQEGVTSSGVPGSVAGLLYALEKHGTMKIDNVIQPAIDLAKDGFHLSYQLAQLMNAEIKDFKRYKSSEKVFTKNGAPFSEGDIFKQPDLAKTLSLIKVKGRDGFYCGEVAELILKQVQKLGGYISLQDLMDYKVIEKEPVNGSYRGFNIVSMPPSSSGGIALIQALNILENFHFSKEDWNRSKYIHKLVEAFKFVFEMKNFIEYLSFGLLPRIMLKNFLRR
jgi:gamma-glutamyltranspeptidase/glutathione hydrolase